MSTKQEKNSKVALICWSEFVKGKQPPRNICGKMINSSQQDCLQQQGNFDYLKMSVAMLEIGYMKRRTVSMKSSCRKKMHLMHFIQKCRHSKI